MCISAATYVQNRMSTKALGGCTPYRIIYRDKLDIPHLGVHAFRVPCAVIELKEKLKKRYDRVMSGAVRNKAWAQGGKYPASNGAAASTLCEVGRVDFVG